MTDRPILFSAPMVCALLADRKLQTRRVLTKLRRFGPVTEFGRSDTRGYDWHFRDKEKRWHDLKHGKLIAALHFAISDRLWVKETWAPLSALKHNDPGCTALAAGGFYRADNSAHDDEISKWKPSIFMPRWASRITLVVTDVRIERLQDISEADAEAEGVGHCKRCNDVGWINSGPDGGWQCDAPGCGDGYVECFQPLWQSINAKRPGCAWDDNPWVVALTFRVIKANIDSAEASI